MGKYGDLVAATSQCVNKGETCLAHCITLLGDGDKELAACAKTVEDIIASCTALRQMAATNSPHVAKFAAVVSDICNDFVRLQQAPSFGFSESRIHAALQDVRSLSFHPSSIR
jgi:Cys-rich four helix bundle protein (predicted Tat secretion target)